jgi:glycosyltransferase involved in cell wall biosynthesis
MVLHHSSPARYQAWLEALIDRTEAHRFFGERMVCVNAWNEWAEGAYLEPDVHFGAAYANATGRAVAGMRPVSATPGLLLIGHDAFAAGAQHLLLHLGETLKRRCGIDVSYLLLDGGALRAAYEKVAPTVVAGTPDDIRTGIEAAASRGVARAIVNTSAAAGAVPLAVAAGLTCTMLVHEMPGLLDERGLIGSVTAAVSVASRVVFPAQAVADRFTALVPVQPQRVRIRPQGCYRPVGRDPEAGAAVRARHGIAASAPVVLGVGTGDLRKGIDLFLHVWRALRRQGREGVVFCWIGEIDPGLRVWLGAEIAAAVRTGSFVSPGFQHDIAAWFSAADVFALTSREDPFPTVVLEAMSSGLAVVAFAGSGGAPELIARVGAGIAVPMNDTEAFAQALAALLDDPRPGRRKELARSVARDFAFGDYAVDMLREAWPELPAVSVAITCCDYARYLPQRLASVFSQTLPVTEVLLHDDASTDDGVAVARAIADDWRRQMTIHAETRRSGSPFGMWGKAVDLARGDWLWIAEADDAAEPGLLEALAVAATQDPGTVLAVCDSRAIDAEGRTLWPDHHAYYADNHAAGLAANRVIPAREFARSFLAERNMILNVSAVLWRRSALAGALDRCGGELASWRLAGDWRLYVELLADCDGTVAWVATPLNLHRRHGASVTTRTKAARHLQEIARMHRLIAARMPLDRALRERQAAYRDAVRRELTGRR